MFNKELVKNITDLRTDPLNVFRDAEEKASPLFVFNRTEPLGVVLSWEEYERIQEKMEDLRDIAELKEARETSQGLVDWKVVRENLTS
jgi:prevent-host-death family protein